MFYLPPLPDPAVINGSGHVGDSEKLEAYLIALAELDNVLIDDLPVPTPGTNGHVAWHNSMVKNIKAVADSLGVSVTLPPLTVKPGDLDHVTHHNIIRQALLDISLNAWNKATGGTVTEYTKDGKRYRLHTFNGDGVFTTQIAVKPFRVLVVGGGGGGQRAKSGGASPGAGGACTDVQTLLSAKDYPVKVGGGGGGGTGGTPTEGEPGANGGVSSIADYVMAGGLGGGQGGGGTSPFNSDITGTLVTYAGTAGVMQDGYRPGMGGGQGEGGGGGGGANWGASGSGGLVIISYQIGET